MTAGSNPIEPVVPPRQSSNALHLLISAMLSEAGFDAADAPVILEIERMTLDLLDRLHGRSVDLANLANRLNPNAYDLLEACEDEDIPHIELHQAASQKMSSLYPHLREPLPILPLPAPPPEFLASGSEGEGEDTTPTENTTGGGTSSRKRKKAAAAASLPSYSISNAPPLPPSHSYKNTLKKPKRTSTIPTFSEMDAKLEAARLVEGSLARLIKSTSGKSRRVDETGMDWEGTADARIGEEEDEDDDLLGVVNYRKRAGAA